MPSEIRAAFTSGATFSITLASLASGSSRQSTMVANATEQYGAKITFKIKSGAAAPTAGNVYEIYLLRGDTFGIRDDGAGASDAAITIENAPLLGTIRVTATNNKNFFGVFDTWALGPLGPEWGVAVKNASGQALSTNETDFTKCYEYYTPETQ